MNAREKDAHLDLCRRLATALNRAAAAEAKVAAVEAILHGDAQWRGKTFGAAIRAALDGAR